MANNSLFSTIIMQPSILYYADLIFQIYKVPAASGLTQVCGQLHDYPVLKIVQFKVMFAAPLQQVASAVLRYIVKVVGITLIADMLDL